ncbi:hypothetical protein AAKU67_003688 [Oxalobacteraceae bacterium GrIS 2.11]
MQSPITRPSSSPVLSLTWGQKLKEMVALKTSTIDPAQRENIAKFLRCDPVKIRTAYDSEIAAMIVDACKFPSRHNCDFDVNLKLTGLHFTDCSCEFPDNITLDNCVLDGGNMSYSRGIVQCNCVGFVKLNGPGKVYANVDGARAYVEGEGAEGYATASGAHASARGFGATAYASNSGTLSVSSDAEGYVMAGSKGEAFSGAIVVAKERGAIAEAYQGNPGKAISFEDWSKLNGTDKYVPEVAKRRTLNIQGEPESVAVSSGGDADDAP